MHSLRTTQSRLLQCMLLALLGFAGNWFKLELFFNVDFLFGSIFVLLAIARLGIFPGLAAGIIAGSCTWLLWHNPWAMIVMACEALVVGFLVKRRNISLVAADTVFWMLLGIPLVWGFYHHLLAIDPHTTALIALKQTLNGISNALIAQLILLTFQFRSRSEKNLLSLRALVFTSMLAVVQFTGMLALTIDLRHTAARQTRDLAQDTHHKAQVAATMLEQWISQQHQAIITLARLVGDPEHTRQTTMQLQVASFNATSPSFLRVGVFNKEAVSVAYDPLLDDNGHSTLGVDLSNRPFIATIQQSLKPYVADIVIGRIGKSQPVLPLLAPIVINGAYGGHCAGIVDISLIKGMLASIVDTYPSNITIQDRSGQVVSSTRSDLQLMQRFERPTKDMKPVGEHVLHWVTPGESGTNLIKRWQSSLLIAERQISPELPWRVTVESSPRGMLDALTRESIMDLLRMLLIFLVTAGIADVICRRTIKPLELLSKVTGSIPTDIPNVDTTSSWPNSRITEIAALSGNFRTMTDLLADKFRQQALVHGQLLQETEARLGLEESMKLLRERIEEEERRRVARDIHDGLGQTLQAIKLNLKLQQQRCQSDHPCQGGPLNAIVGDISRASEDLRDIVSSLRPVFLDSTTLDEALRWHCDRLARRVEQTIMLHASGDFVGLGNNCKLSLFRIFQEALANALKHSKATCITITLAQNDKSIVLTIIDNGVGNVQKAVYIGSGLSIMQERVTLLGGLFHISSPADAGTHITIEVPTA